ncbi:hypothetical protein M407DRAFT_19349 [Tulasnella calospora MUT 4182]|uniref:Protein kinase domain-containing protein n=1 Tax=Tulasnella calospora MUT 4182 TaxID=1051891 RepID=A0A0C3QRY4_9AGAM|nr:hypothetical protein M407DRAFT_19349 [Tulasnella calospora MUT 4182]
MNSDSTSHIINPSAMSNGNGAHLGRRKSSGTPSSQPPGWWFNESTPKQLPDPLAGGLARFDKRTIQNTASNIFQGRWTKSSGEEVPVTIKVLMNLKADGRTVDSYLTEEGRFERRIAREIIIWRAMSHENILQFIGYQIVGGTPLLVSPFCRNGNLAEYLHANPNVTYTEQLKLLRGAARGLGHLHYLEPPVVHGQVHPDNILVTDDLRAVICGFGLSRIMTRSRSGFTTAETVPSKAGFMAKETIVGSTRGTPMSDVYGLGGVILATMTGKYPFYETTRVGALLAVICDRMPQPVYHPKLPASNPLWNLMRQCWSPNPTQRPLITQVIYKLNLIRDCGIGFTAPFRQTIFPTPAIAPPEPEESVVQPGASLPPLPSPLLGTLELIEPVGRGGYGEVYRGLWTAPEKHNIPVAIKCLTIGDIGAGQDQSSVILMRRIRRETVIWKAAEHPNVLTLYGYQIINGNPMLISPWCKNGDLYSFVKAHPELTREEKLKLLLGTGKALAHLHSLQPPICHGDIKPQNVIIGDKMEALLCDFGISRIITGPGVTGMTTRGVTTGTAGFGAKEVLLGKRPVEGSDVYGFGGLILATMTGNRPFYNKPTEGLIFVAVFNGEIPQPADHPQISETDPLWSLMKKCWNSEPSERPSMIQIVAEASCLTIGKPA